MKKRWNARSLPAAPEPAADVTVHVDGQPVRVPRDATVLEAAREAGVDIPTLCHDDRLDPTGACRMCLVESSDSRRLVPACRHPVRDGLKVQTETEKVGRQRRALLSLYLADLPAGPMPGTELARHIDRYGAEPALPQVNAPRAGRSADDNRFITFQPEHCILCARCTRYCDEVEAVSAISLGHRGSETSIVTSDTAGLLDTTCELCGGCIDTCPSGAMIERSAVSMQATLPALEKVRTTCNYCGVGCQMDIEVDVGANKVVRVTSPETGTTTNDGNLCVKGRFGYSFVDHPERLQTPMMRGADGELHPTDWDTALDRAIELLGGVAERHGADALGFVSSSRCTNEENYLVQKLSRAGFGTNNVHQCAAT